jgi:hypothetical protein
MRRKICDCACREPLAEDPVAARMRAIVDFRSTCGEPLRGEGDMD